MLKRPKKFGKFLRPVILVDFFNIWFYSCVYYEDVSGIFKYKSALFQGIVTE